VQIMVERNGADASQEIISDPLSPIMRSDIQSSMEQPPAQRSTDIVPEPSANITNS
jgi:hypothetical protein